MKYFEELKQESFSYRTVPCCQLLILIFINRSSLFEKHSSFLTPNLASHSIATLSRTVKDKMGTKMII